MNKQKQIEEMSNNYKCCYPCEMFDGYIDDEGNLFGRISCLNGMDSSKCGVSTDFAKFFIKQGYRKIPEGSVVLTEEEFNEFRQTIITQSQEYTKLCDEMNDKIIKAHKQAVKEVLKMLKDNCRFSWTNSLDFTYNQIAKKYDIEVD